MNKQIATSYLFIGNETTLTKNTINFLQLKLCPNNNCQLCTTCVQIQNKTHNNTTWITPQNRYNKNDLEPIFQQSKFKLNAEIHSFFILTNAHTLSLSCANSLLKLIEEPPTGYHFIFHSPNEKNIIATIRSRCHIHKYNNTSNIKFENLYNHLIGSLQNPVDFLKILTTSSINEYDAAELINQLIAYYIQLYKQEVYDNENHNNIFNIQNKITTLTKYIENSIPMGSASLILKNIYLQNHTIQYKYIIKQ